MWKDETLTLNQLKYFLAIIGAGSISKASRQIFVAQPALSNQIKLLEDELGQILFYRNANGVVLTEAGKKLQDRAIGILRQVDALKEELTSSISEPVGSLAIGLAMALNMRMSEQIYRKLNDSYPKLRVRLMESMSGFLPQLLEDGQIDLALAYDAKPYRNHKVEKLGHESLYWVTTPKNVRMRKPHADFDTIQKIGLILPGFPHSLRLLIDRQFHLHGLRPNIKIEVDSTYTIKKMIVSENLSSILSVHTVKEEVESGQLVALPIQKPSIDRDIHLVTGYQRQNDPIVALARNAIVELFQT